MPSPWIRLVIALALTCPAIAHADDACSGKPFDTAALKAQLTALASPALDGRKAGTPENATARGLIMDRFKCLGLSVEEQRFDITTKATAANVVATLKGTSDETIVVGAHHDHLGAKHLGANDNASGVVAILAIAQAMTQGKQPARTVVFVTFDAEEEGLVGSTQFVAHPPKGVDLAKVVAFINLDMVGSYSSTNAVYAFGSFPATAPGKLLDRLDDKYPKLRVGLGGHSVRGDQVAFCGAKIPYVFFWTPDKRCYHETCDTVDKIDLPHMAMIASLAHDLVRGLADSTTDLAAARAKTGCGHK